MRLFLILVISVLFSIPLHAQQGKPAGADSLTAVRLAQAQLDAYNRRDIEAFLEPYADTVSVYRYPAQLLSKGKENMRKEYAQMFQQLPDLHCTLVKRIVLGQTVIDEESVFIGKGLPLVRAVAIYTISGGKIDSVTFIQ